MVCGQGTAVDTSVLVQFIRNNFSRDGQEIDGLDSRVKEPNVVQNAHSIGKISIAI